MLQEQLFIFFTIQTKLTSQNILSIYYLVKKSIFFFVFKTQLFFNPDYALDNLLRNMGSIYKNLNFNYNSKI